MGNKLIISTMEDEESIQHYGVIGMRWGKRRAGRRVNSLEKKVNKTVRKFDKGKDDPDGVNSVSKKVRSQKYKLDKKIKRGEKYLAKAATADAKQIVNRYNRDPNKKALVQDYINSLKTNSAQLAELRSRMMDIRIK